MVRGTALAIWACTLLFSAANADPAPDADIGGTGRIEPRGGVVMLGGPSGAVIKIIKAHVGDTVKRGDLLAILDDSAVRADQQIAQLAFNQAKLVGEQTIATEAMAVRVAENHYKQAQSDADAYVALGPTATSAHQIAVAKDNAYAAKAALATERSKEKQVRAGALADTNSAALRLKEANDRLAAYQIRAPSDGTILRIDQHEGEPVGGAIMALGDISAMYVICQVFQGDLLKLKPGMKARINNNALGRELTGTVERVSRLVDTKAQLGDVQIRLNDTGLASRVVGMEVEVKITP
jgi:multidrug resistance efflux pump